MKHIGDKKIEAALLVDNTVDFIKKEWCLACFQMKPSYRRTFNGNICRDCAERNDNGNCKGEE